MISWSSQSSLDLSCPVLSLLLQLPPLLLLLLCCCTTATPPPCIYMWGCAWWGHKRNIEEGVLGLRVRWLYEECSRVPGSVSNTQHLLT